MCCHHMTLCIVCMLCGTVVSDMALNVSHAPTSWLGGICVMQVLTMVL